MRLTEKSKAIQVFEHDKLMVGEHRADVVFQEKHRQALQSFQAQKKHPFYTVIHQGIRFNSFVGIIALPDLVIEVLPKADAYEKDPGVWRNWLVSMLLECKLISPYAAPSTGIHLHHNHLLDLWIQQFLEATEALLQQGLQKKYALSESSQPTLRGKILFSKNIRHSIIHKEKLYTRYHDYNNHHILHYALWQALDVLKTLPCAAAHKEKAIVLKSFFPENKQRNIAAGIRRLHYNRQTAHYRPAIELAFLLLEHLAPGAQTGDFSSLAFMVDMNRLYEEYIYRKLNIAGTAKGYALKRQVSAPFWSRRSLRPDMVLYTSSGAIVLDTKWKILNSNQPPEEDLKQIYVYNHYFQAQRGILLYPKVNDEQVSYRSAYHQSASKPLYCEVLFVPVINKDKTLNRSVGKDILKLMSN